MGSSFNKLEQGTLVVVGGGRIPFAVCESYVGLAGGHLKANIVVIPSAASNADDPIQHETFLSIWRDFAPRSLRLLHTSSHDHANNWVFVGPLREATGVWFGGGDPKLLASIYRGTLVHSELHQLLARGGVIGGTSAGATVMSDRMIEHGTDTWAQDGPGFGFLTGVIIDQHFAVRNRIGRLRNLLRCHPDYAGIGIDEGTAAIIDISKESLTVSGESTITALHAQSSAYPGHEQTLRSGATLNLNHLKKHSPIQK